MAGFWNPGLWVIAAIDAWKATQWNKGIRWINNSEGYWNELIDCTGDQTQEVQLTVRIPSDDYYCEQYLLQGGPYCLEYEACLDLWAERCAEDPDDCWVEVVITERLLINRRSDGFICRNSQIGATAIDVYEATGANHSEEVDPASSVQGQLRACFDRDDFFGTE